MHQGQDSFAHYDAGYRWYTAGHGLANLCGRDPDSR
jgi:hypothetical protein